jgi:hypothetical protein
MKANDFYASRIEQHPVHAQIGTLQAAIDNVPAATEDIEARLERVQFILRRLALALKKAEPVAITGTGLTSCVQSLSQATSQINAYVQNQNVAHLEKANDAMDGVLQLAISWDKTSSGKLSDAAAMMLAEMRGEGQRSLNTLEAAIAAVTDQLNKLRESADEIRTEIDRKTQSFNSELERYGQRYEGEEEGRRKTARDVTDSFANDAKAAIEKANEDLQGLLSEGKEQLRAFAEEGARKSSEALTELEASKVAAQKLVGIVGETGMSAGYNREANVARVEAVIWNGITLASLVWVAWVAFHFLNSTASGQEKVTWESLVARSLLLAVSGAIATFGVRQSARASRTSEANRRYQLQLASVGPFIAELDAPTKQDIKKGIVERMYGQTSESAVDGAEKTPVTGAQMIVEIMKQVPAIIKAGK